MSESRVLLYSLTHGGYVNFSGTFGPRFTADQMTPAEAQKAILNLAGLRLVIADLEGWISGDDALPPEGLAIETRGYRPDEPGAWRPAQEERDGPEVIGVDLASGPDRHVEAVIAGPVTPDHQWRPAQEKRDGLAPCSVCGRPTGGCCTVADHSTNVTVTAPPLPTVVAGPVTPDAAGVGGVREMLREVHRRAYIDALHSCNVTSADLHDSPDFLESQRTILAALPEGELIDLGERKWCEEDFEGEMNYAPLRGVPGPGIYRVFLQRKEAG